MYVRDLKTLNNDAGADGAKCTVECRHCHFDHHHEVLVGGMVEIGDVGGLDFGDDQ